MRSQKLKGQKPKTEIRFWNEIFYGFSGSLDNRWMFILCLLLFAFLIVGCRQDMAEQPRYDPFEASTFFADGQSARPLPPGTVARGYLREDTEFYTGKSGKDFTNTFPFPVTWTVLERGQERYNIFCSPCHDRTGSGNGMIVRRGYTPPPSFHQDRLREAPVGYFFDVITNGFGAMPDYATQIPPRDRWAIIAYIRALQLSQHARLEDIPAEERAKLSR
ncbi:MAG TPA: cytochrome c [Candidatus Limnocylindrales bacterium]|nr:cytochrome c [Candidatus Limnocylindrales bacterium]